MHHTCQELAAYLPEVSVWGRQLKGNIDEGGEGTGMALFCQVISQSLQQRRSVSVACSTAVAAHWQQHGTLTGDAAKLTAQEGTADWPAHDLAWKAGCTLESLQAVRATQRSAGLPWLKVKGG